MARVDIDPEDRDKEPLRLVAMFDCPECDAVVDHVFTAPEGVYEAEDLIEAPVETITCTNPECGHQWEEAWSGWMQHQDQAG